MVAANKIEYKDAHSVLLPADVITHKPNKPYISLESLFSSYRVGLAKYNRVLRVLFPLLQVTGGG